MERINGDLDVEGLKYKHTSFDEPGRSTRQPNNVQSLKESSAIAVPLSNYSSDSSSRVEAKTYSIISQFNNPVAQETIRLLNKLKVATSIQIKVLLDNYNDQNGTSLITAEDWVKQALRYQAAVQGDRYSAPGNAALEINDWINYQKEIPKNTDIYREYIKARCHLTDSQVDLMLFEKGKLDLNFDLTMFPNLEIQADFFRNPLFLSQPDLPDKWLYRKGKKVILPYGERVKEFTVTKCNTDMVTLKDEKWEYSIPKGYLSSNNKYSFTDKINTIGRFLSSAVDFCKFQLQMAGVMIAYNGRIHPAKTPDGWNWVIEPNANIEEDPKQLESFNYYGDKNKYYRLFTELKQKGVKIITEEHLKDHGGLPSVYLYGFQLRALDHHRLRGADDAGMAIGINITKEVDTFN